MTVEEKIEEMGFEDVVIFKDPDYEDAFIGCSSDGCAVYDYNLMIESLMKEDKMTDLEAMEFIDYNTLRAITYFDKEGNGAPIVLHKYE